MIIAAYTFPIVLFIFGIVYKKSKYVLFLFAIYFWVLYGLNTFTPDYYNYKWIYDYSTYLNINLNVEYGYRLICIFFYKIGLTYEQFRMIWGAVYVIFICATAQRLTNYYNYVLALLIIWPFVPMVSSMRFSMAYVIVNYSIVYLIEDKRWNVLKYIIGVLIASFIHSSAIFYLVFVFSKKRLKIKNYITIAFAAFFAAVLLKTSLIDIIIQRFFSGTMAHKLEKWLSINANTGINHPNFFRFFSEAMVIVGFAWIINQFYLYIQNNYIENEKSDAYYIKKILLFKNISFLMVLIIPTYIVSAEFHRLIYGILPTFYAMFAEFRFLSPKNNKDNSKINKFLYQVLFYCIIILMVAIYLLTIRTHDVFATFKDNMIFEYITG